MANMTITNIDPGSVAVKDPQFADDILQLAGADEIAAGTILARKKVVTAITPVAGTNTGTGTCTEAAVVNGSVIPIVGSYVLTCITAVAHGGIFKLVDPNGALVAGYLPMTAGSGAATVFEVGGLTFKLTDAGDFIVGDSFTLPVVADNDLVLYSPTGIGGASIPCAVLTKALSAASGADYPVRPLISGVVNKDRLIIDADGTGANITAVILDQLRAVGIVAVSVSELGDYDTQD